MNKPNIFDYATSELSHDAFIAWLMSWADPQFEGHALHELSRDVLFKCFINTCQLQPDSLKVEVIRQHYHIDVFVKVTTTDNTVWGLIFENKVYTHQHSDQLNRYKATIAEKENLDADNILGIYYKMWEQSNMNVVNSSGYFHLDRKMMLELLDQHIANIQSDIVLHYYSYLTTMQDTLNAYKIKPTDDWNSDQWVGFYAQLKKDMNLEGSDFDYVPNRSGGFWGYWFGSQSIGNEKAIYLQSEQNRLCFKLYIQNKGEQQEAKWQWHTILLEIANKHGLDVIKPPVMKIGTCFTIGIIKSNNDCWLVTDSNNIIDYEKTKQLAFKAVEVVKEASMRAMGGSSS